jgi:predicted negative regulator of RcsB-dependent stress response
MRLFILALLILIIAGVFVSLSNQLGHIGTPPDPNDPKQAGLMTPEVLRRDLKGASDSLLERLHSGEIDDAQFKDLMARAANLLLKSVKVENIPSQKAWEYGEVFVTARKWKEAKQALEIAVKAAKDEDRRVNDNLRLARVLAELGDVQGAISTARGVFNTTDGAAAPILPATLLEIVPAAEGKKHDAELGALLEDAIKCESRTIVDTNTEPGKAFLMARPFHVRNAWNKIMELYLAAGKEDEVKAAAGRRDAMMREQAGA